MNGYFAFETHTPAEPSSSNVSVKAVICYFCRKKGHTAQNCQKKKKHPKKKRDQLQPKDQKSSSRKAVTKRQRFPCVMCESTDHRCHQCPRRAFTPRHPTDKLHHQALGPLLEGEGAMHVAALFIACCVLVACRGMCCLSLEPTTD